MGFVCVLISELWTSILYEVRSERARRNLPFAPHNRPAVLQFGLHHPLVVQMIEQLPHADRCDLYTFTYHRPANLSSWRDHVSMGVWHIARDHGSLGVWHIATGIYEQSSVCHE